VHTEATRLQNAVGCDCVHNCGKKNRKDAHPSSRLDHIPTGRPVSLSHPAAAACVHHSATSKPCQAPSPVCSRPACTCSTGLCSCSCTPRAEAWARRADATLSGWPGNNLPPQNNLRARAKNVNPRVTCQMQGRRWVYSQWPKVEICNIEEKPGGGRLSEGRAEHAES
jgi:hypothetical protein